MTEIKVRVDFGEYSEDGRLTAVLEKTVLEVGETVAMCDAEGNFCWGSVADLTARLAFIDPSWDTWTPAEIHADASVGQAHAGFMVKLQETVQTVTSAAVAVPPRSFKLSLA